MPQTKYNDGSGSKPVPIDQRIRDKAIHFDKGAAERGLEKEIVDWGESVTEWANREARPVLRRVRDVLNAFLVTPKDVESVGFSLSVDWSDKRSATVMLTEALTAIVFTDPTDCGDYVLLLEQLPSPATPVAVSGWPSSVRWPGATPPTITATAGRTDLIRFYWDGTNYWATLTQDLG